MVEVSSDLYLVLITEIIDSIADENKSSEDKDNVRIVLVNRFLHLKQYC